MSSHIQIYADRNLSVPLQQKQIDDRRCWFLDFDTLYAGEERTFRFFVENQSRFVIENLKVSVDAIDEDGIVISLSNNEIGEMDSFDAREFYMTWSIPENIEAEHCSAQLSLKYNISTRKKGTETVEALSYPALFQTGVSRRDAPQKPRQSLRESKTRERKEWNCSFYVDQLGMHPVSVIEFGRVHEGETKIVEVWLKNNDIGAVEKLEYKVLRNDIAILSTPKSLGRDELALLKIAWTPGNDFRLGLKDDLEIDGELVIE